MTSRKNADHATEFGRKITTALRRSNALENTDRLEDIKNGFDFKDWRTLVTTEN